MQIKKDGKIVNKYNVEFFESNDDIMWIGKLPLKIINYHSKNRGIFSYLKQIFKKFVK